MSAPQSPRRWIEEGGSATPFERDLLRSALSVEPPPDAQKEVWAGVLAAHEYSVRDSAAATAVWHAVCWGIIIPSGWLRTRDTTLYRHLWRSVLAFDGADRFAQRLSDAGFDGVHTETMSGWERGVVHTFLGNAPLGNEPLGNEPE